MEEGAARDPLTEPMDRRYVYRIYPVNLDGMHDDERAKALSGFSALLLGITRPMAIWVSRRSVEVEVGDRTASMVVPEAHLASSEPLDSALLPSGLQFTVSSGLERPAVRRHALRGLELADGRTARCFVFYSLPSALPPAWIMDLMNMGVEPAAGRAREMLLEAACVAIRPIEQHIAATRMRGFTENLKVMVARDETEAAQLEAAQRLTTMISNNRTRLFGVTVTVILAGRADELQRKERRLSMYCKQSFCKVDAPAALHLDLWNARDSTGADLTLDLDSMAPFFAFASNDLMETPGGIAIGTSSHTGAPIVFNYRMRPNYNTAIIGWSGAGKSFLTKMLARRFLRKNPDAILLGIDPKSEYAAGLSDVDGMRIVDVEMSRRLGFDPFRIFDDNPTLAAGFLADIADVGGDVKARKAFKAVAQGCSSLEDMYRHLRGIGEGKDYHTYLDDFVRGGQSEVFRGDATFGSRTVLAFNDASEDDERILLLLSLGKFWKMIRSMPRHVPKLLIIDEGWKLFRHRSIAQYVMSIAKLGRAYNVWCVFIVQELSDMVSTVEGKSYLNNAGTKFLMKNTEAEAQLLLEHMGLSEEERDTITAFDTGECLLLTDRHRLLVRIEPLSDEYEMFDTNPNS